MNKSPRLLLFVGTVKKKKKKNTTLIIIYHDGFSFKVSAGKGTYCKLWAKSQGILRD